MDLFATTDGGFEIDPFVIFGDAPSPYRWYGLNPTLFDAPFSLCEGDEDLGAHSFLADDPAQGSVRKAATRRAAGRLTRTPI